MPRGKVTKIDVLQKLYKLKNDLYNMKYPQTSEWYRGSHDSLNKIIDYLKEYSE